MYLLLFRLTVFGFHSGKEFNSQQSTSVSERLSYQGKVCYKYADNLEKEEVILWSEIGKDKQILSIDK